MSSFHPRTAISSIVLLLCASLSATAQQHPTWPLEGTAFASTPEHIRAAAANIAAEPFAATTVFFERDAYSLDSAGRMTYRHTLLYRIETQAGVDEWSEIRLRWAPWHQDAPEIRARVIGPDGKVSTLDPKTITDGPAREDSADTYTDERVHKAPLPGVTAGAIVEMETVSPDKVPFFASGGVYADSFSRGVPSLHSELRIEVPATTQLRYQIHGLPEAQMTNEVQGAVRCFSLVQGYLPGQANSDINLSSHELSGPTVLFSTGDSWAAIASGYWELAESRIDPTEVKALLPPVGRDRLDTIARIVATLHKEVRYTGIEFGSASLQPAPAAEVLKRHYGDCKDKAALLTAMLRSAGIPAYLALLDSGPGFDISPDLPGMNFFDHAIVYVPAAGASPALWIDATAEFTEVGTLPAMDQDRQALIIAPETTALTRTPAAKSEDDHLIEMRDVELAEEGPATISETSITHGEVDSSYRSLYGSELTRENRENLESYAKNEYMAKSLGAVTHGEPRDFAHPFALKLAMKEAKRGNTASDDAVVGIPFADIFFRLPGWFRTDPKIEGVTLTPQQEEDLKRGIAARSSEYDVHPFVTEWQYTITPPEGYVLRALPADKVTNMGPAVFSQNYKVDGGVVKANLRFEVPKSRFTSQEVLALREAVLATFKEDEIAIWFDQAGAKLIAAGKIREGLAADRELIAKNPNSNLHHVQLAFAYLTAGLGDRARQEAQRAVELDSKSVAAYRALGWVCQFNEIGVRFAPGFDLKCALDAQKKAAALDPDDSNIAVSLAYLNEIDAQGERYGPTAHLGDAIAGYRALAAKDKATGDEYEDSLLFDLFYAGRYEELLKELDKLSATPARRALAIAATVAQKGGPEGVAAGIERANQLSASADERNAALAKAGDQLLQPRRYPEALGILSAAAGGQENSAQVAQWIAVVRQLKPWNGGYLPTNDPRSVVQRMFMNDPIDERLANTLLARQAFPTDEEWQRNFERIQLQRGMLQKAAAHSVFSSAGLLDVLAGNLKLTAEGDDASGYRITAQRLGARPSHYFVVKESGGYKLVTDWRDGYEAGNEALYLLTAGREKEAHSLLNWTREILHKGGGDDPLSGPLFTRYWTSGQEGDKVAMQVAAASLIVDRPEIAAQIPMLRKAWQNAADGEAKLNLNLLLAHAYSTTGEGDNLKQVAAELLKKYPDSYVALGMTARAYSLLKRWNDWKQLIAAQIAKHPDDDVLQRLKSEYAEEEGDWQMARSALQVIIDKGDANANDYNSLSWSSLYDGKITDEMIKDARQATMLTNNRSFAEMHTLACLYAAQGKTKEARDLLLKAMDAGNMTIPNEAVWFGLGSIYEQYGIDDAALEAYRKVEKPDGRIGATSTWVLAQKRIDALTASKRAGQ